MLLYFRAAIYLSLGFGVKNWIKDTPLTSFCVPRLGLGYLQMAIKQRNLTRRTPATRSVATEHSSVIVTCPLPTRRQFSRHPYLGQGPLFVFSFFLFLQLHAEIKERLFFSPTRIVGVCKWFSCLISHDCPLPRALVQCSSTIAFLLSHQSL